MTMKNTYGILAGVIALAALMVSCMAEQDTTPEVDITTVRCTIPQIDVEEDFATGILDTLTVTKATFSNGNFLWSAGDKIGIVPNTGAQIYFEVSDGAGTSTASFNGGDWAMKSTGTFYAYYPLYPDIFLSKDHVSVSYTGQTQSGNNNNLHTGDFWTLYTEGTTAVGNALNFSFNHLTSFFKTYITVPAGTYTKITFSAPSEVFIKDGYFDLSAQTPTIVGTTMTDELSLNLQNVTFADETELTGYLVLPPVDITGVPITVTVYKDGEPTYEYTLTKANPMVAAKTYAFRATSITQLAASATQANALFAAGATSVSITEPLTEDMAIVLPNTSEAVTLILPTTASTSTLTVSYPPAAESYPATLSITGPEGADLDIRTPNSTVTVNGIAYDQVISRTAANTCIIPVGVTVNNLKVVQGGVQVYGTVTQIDLSEQEDDAIISVSGTVSSLLGEDDEEYAPATGVSLNKTSINLNVGATETLTATIAPVGAYSNLVWSSSNVAVATVSSTGVVTAVAAGSATITATTISGGFTATCNVSVSMASAINGHPYVDIGFRKSHIDSRITPGSAYDRKIVFATCNIGANSPEDFGYYFRWGELNGWMVTAPFINDSAPIINAIQYDKEGNNMGTIWSSSTFDSSYALWGRTDIEDFNGKTNLQCNGATYGDAATYIWGGSWRAPDKALLNILTTGDFSSGPIDKVISNSAGSITLHYSFVTQNEVRGLLIENQALSRSLFLPAAGYCSGNYVFCGDEYTVGYYYSSSAEVPGYSTRVMSVIISAYNGVYMSDTASGNGESIRPVAELTMSDEYIPAELPSVGVVSVQNVGDNNASISSSLDSDGNTITEFGFYYGTSVESMNSHVRVSGYSRGYSPGDFSKEITGLNPGTTYYVKSYATNEAGNVESNVVSFTTTATTGSLNGYSWVDLGLSSGLRWATMNIGGSSTNSYPYQIGCRYAWGETSPKAEYNWNNYTYGGYDPEDDDYHWLDKYYTHGSHGVMDGKTVLESNDDAAYVRWGEGWRMPRIYEFEELCTSCTWTWTTISNVNGYSVTGPNGNSIFLPMTGDQADYGTCSVYWSSDLETGNGDDCARCLEFDSSDYTATGWRSFERAEGHCIRPVTE